jgi:LacI family transcriptional regulator
LRIPFGSGDRYEIDSFHDVTTELLQRILDNGHDAILCFNDSIAILVYQTAMELGLKIPDAFSLTGFDNSPAQALITRRIDTINLSSRVFGREAACWLRKTVIEREPQRLRLLVEGEYLPGSTI